MPARAVTFHYSRTRAPDPSYEREGHVVVFDWTGVRLWREQAKRIRAAGGEVLQYTLPYHDYPSNASAPEVGLFYTGQTRNYSRSLVPAGWYWDPANPDRVRVGSYSGRVMDLRPGSAFVDHLVDVYFPAMAADPEIDGFMLDVTGTGWRGQTTGLQTPELATINAGQVELVNRLRQKIGYGPILVANNSWQEPHPLLNGIVVENHTGTEINNAYWSNQIRQVGRGLPKTRRRNLIIVRSVADACAWATNPDATHVTATPASANYQYGPVLPYGPCEIGGKGWEPGDNHEGGEIGPPPPPPDLPDEVDALRAEVARLTADNASLRATLTDRDRDLNGAREARDQALEAARGLEARIAAGIAALGG